MSDNNSETISVDDFEVGFLPHLDKDCPAGPIRRLMAAVYSSLERGEPTIGLQEVSLETSTSGEKNDRVTYYVTLSSTAGVSPPVLPLPGGGGVDQGCLRAARRQRHRGHRVGGLSPQGRGHPLHR